MKRSTFKLLFLLKKSSAKKNGLMPILARITINNQRVHFSTKLEIDPEKWDADKNKVLGRNAEAANLNAILDGIKVAITNIYHEESNRCIGITAEKIKNIFIGYDDSNEQLIAMFTKHNEDIKRLIGISVTQTTYNKYELAKRRLVEFLQVRYNLSDIFMKELKLSFIKDYEIFLRVNCKLSNNVAAKMIMYLKKIVTISFNNGSIKSNPFANFHIKREKVDRGFLTDDELETIMAKKIDIPRLDAIRDVFLFCCFTGLSYIDIKQLKKSNISKSSDGNLWINTKRQKTNSSVNVMLLDIPIAILNKYTNTLEGDQVLPVLSNQKCNSYLKELADICGISKNLTFHQSRHTFATTVTLSNGVPIESVSKMLGHSSIKTTQIYSRVTNEKINRDMQMLSGKIGNLTNAYKG